jgi:MarR family transcriptional regulator, lower aerobic nicotinate degradation pathway regulator
LVARTKSNTLVDVVTQPSGVSTPPAADAALSPADGLAQLAFLIHGMLERRAREHDLSIIQMRLLGVLRDRTPTMNELARMLDLDKSSVTGLIDRAERRGLVVRVPSTADRRAVLVSLTDHGRPLVSAGAARFEADISLLLERLVPAERDALARLVSRLLVAHATDHGIDLFATTGAEAREDRAGSGEPARSPLLGSRPPAVS